MSDYINNAEASINLVDASNGEVGQQDVLHTCEWHRAEHQVSRDNMVVEIIKLLKTRRPNATDDWHEKLPHMAKRLEDALYHDAGSLDEYNESSTLEQRLQQLALFMGGNTKSWNNSSGGGGRYAQQGQAQLQQMYQFQQMQQEHLLSLRSQFANGAGELTDEQQQHLLLLRHASKCPHNNGRCPVTPHCWSMKVLWKHIMSCKDQECRVPQCISSRFLLSQTEKDNKMVL